MTTQTTTLPNGLTVATHKTTGKLSAVMVTAMTGSVREQDHEHGLSHFLEHMAFKGTPSRSAHQISMDVEKSGCEINAMTSKTDTSYYVKGLVSHVEKSVDILADVILNSNFDESDIASEKVVVLHEMRDYDDDLQQSAVREHDRVAFGDVPYAREILGTEDSVNGLTQDLIHGYMASHYVGSNMVVSAAGDIDHDQFVAIVGDKFGSVKAGPKAEKIVVETIGGASRLNDKRFQTTEVIISFPYPRVFEEDVDPSIFLSGVLGTGMSSPLFQEVREKRSLCYGVGAWSQSDTVDRRFAIAGSTDDKSVEDFVKVSLGELERVANGEITDHDWERTINSILHSAASSEFSHRRNLSSAVARLARGGKFEVRSVETIEAILKGLSRETISKAAQDMLNSKITLVVAGKTRKRDFSKLIA